MKVIALLKSWPNHSSLCLRFLLWAISISSSNARCSRFSLASLSSISISSANAFALAIFLFSSPSSVFSILAGVASRCSALVARGGTGATFEFETGASRSIGSFLTFISFWTSFSFSTLTGFFAGAGESLAVDLTFAFSLGFSTFSSTREMLSPLRLSYCSSVSPLSYAFFDFWRSVSYCIL